MPGILPNWQRLRVPRERARASPRSRGAPRHLATPYFGTRKIEGSGGMLRRVVMWPHVRRRIVFCTTVGTAPENKHRHIPLYLSPFFWVYTYCNWGVGLASGGHPSAGHVLFQSSQMALLWDTAGIERSGPRRRLSVKWGSASLSFSQSSCLPRIMILDSAVRGDVSRRRYRCGRTVQATRNAAASRTYGALLPILIPVLGPFANTHTPLLQ